MTHDLIQLNGHRSRQLQGQKLAAYSSLDKTLNQTNWVYVIFSRNKQHSWNRIRNEHHNICNWYLAGLPPACTIFYFFLFLFNSFRYLFTCSLSIVLLFTVWLILRSDLLVGQWIVLKWRGTANDDEWVEMVMVRRQEGKRAKAGGTCVIQTKVPTVGNARESHGVVML